MLKDFLTEFSRIIAKTQEQTLIDPDEEAVKRTISVYPLLSEDDKETFFDIVKSFGEQGDEYRLYFEFLCLHFYRDKRFADDVLSCLLSFDMDLDRRFNYYSILGRELFVTGLSTDYEQNVRLEEMLVDEVMSSAAVFPDRIRYDERDKKTVVFVMRPFLGEYHSPSLQTINLDHFLRKLGYTTYYISYSENEILKKYAHDVCSPFLKMELYTGITKFEYDCFDMKINGLHFDIRPDSMSDDLNALAVYISQMRPAFVIGIEGGNILADLCSKYTDMICMNVVDDLPVTLSEYTLRYFPGEYKNGYANAPKYNKMIFDARFDDELMPYNDAEGEEIQLPDGRFHICIMGNRLDDEIDDKMTDIIRRILDEIPETDILFIGNCPKTEKELHDLKDRCTFAGYLNRCEDAVAACSLFLNPPRAGGGGGGYMAIKRGVPVYTLKNCDVASCVGEEFAHDSYDELIPFIKRCIKDDEHYLKMRKISEDNYNKRYKINSLDNISGFLDKFTAHISSRHDL